MPDSRLGKLLMKESGAKTPEDAANWWYQQAFAPVYAQKVPVNTLQTFEDPNLLGEAYSTSGEKSPYIKVSRKNVADYYGKDANAGLAEAYAHEGAHIGEGLEMARKYGVTPIEAKQIMEDPNGVHHAYFGNDFQQNLYQMMLRDAEELKAAKARGLQTDLPSSIKAR